MKYRKFHLALAVLALSLAPCISKITRADDSAASPSAQAARALHLIEGQRYGEAIPVVQALVDQTPNDPLPYQLRGVLDLYLGDTKAGERDFRAAADMLPNNAATQFGQGIMELWVGKWDSAVATLANIQTLDSLTATQKRDIATTKSYIAYLRGKNITVPGSETNSDPLQQELSALVAAKASSAQGATLLQAFLNTSNGVPHVTEDAGLRALFDVSAPVEPAVTDLSLQKTYLASLRDQLAQTAQRSKNSQSSSGVVTLKPPASLSSQTAMVTYSIDDHLAGVVNSPPYEYEWDTKNYANGKHAIKIAALDSSGDVLSSAGRRTFVKNNNSDVRNAGLTTDSDLEGRVWNLLRLRPARKVAEWTLANCFEAKGDSANALSHRAIAAALDPRYKDSRHYARIVFGGSSTGLVKPTTAGVLGGLWTGPQSAKRVALTFDDGPNPQKTPLLLDALDKAKAQATFFVVGARALESPDIVRRMAASGDDVEDHSFTHQNMAQTTPSVTESEILRTSVVIRALTGKPPRFFRPPGGQRNPVVYQLASQYGQRVALWTVDCIKYEEAGSSQALINYVMAHVKPGAIILMHNGMDGTIGAIPGLVAALRAKGYEPVTLTKLMASGGLSAQAASAAK